MSETSEAVLRRRFEQLLDLVETGEEIQRQNLRRRFPEASRAEIERRLAEWFLRSETNPGADGESK